MNKYKLNFQLKQHTPIIHFQHDQQGATLRASELKPKLDKFLIEKSFGGILNFKKYEKFLSGDTKSIENGLEKIGKDSNIRDKDKARKEFLKKQKLAFDYKVRILVDNEPDKYLVTSYLNKGQKELLKENNVLYLNNMPYFAQESEINSLFEKYNSGETDRNGKPIYKTKFINENLKNITKWGLLYKTDATFQIQSFHIPLLERIEEKIYNFFAFENFGTRQSKGFGCFSILEPKPSKDFKAALKEEFRYVYKGITKMKTLQEGMERISKDYKLLKSGRGSKEHGGYAKSQIFLYFLEGKNPIRWEKRKIKRDINNNPFEIIRGKSQKIKLAYDNNNSVLYDKNGNQSWDDPPEGYNYKYIRALLGLAEQFEFQSDPKRYKYMVQVKSENGIDRFRSPIQFIIHENQIYLVANSINKEILSKEDNPVFFKFRLRLKENNILSEKSFQKRDMEKIDTPKEFDIGEFLKFALETGSQKINGYLKL